MEFIPIKTKIFEPPQDDLYAELDRVLTDVHDGDVILISSKVVAIHQGRCVPIGAMSKEALIEEEAEVLIDTPYKKYPITVKHHTFLGAAGVDESNGDGHYILLPEEPFEEAMRIHDFIREKKSVRNIGVIITDSRSQPMRFGATGVGIAFWGVRPLNSHIGEQDLFGKKFRYERSNVIDALAAGAGLESGETNECKPFVIARDVPNLEFVDHDCKEELFASPEEDHFRVLFDSFKEK